MASLGGDILVVLYSLTTSRVASLEGDILVVLYSLTTSRVASLEGGHFSSIVLSHNK